MPTITETLKQKIDDLELDRRYDELSGHVEKAVKAALDKAGEFAADKRADIEGFLDKAEGAVNQRTEGKYAEKVTQVKSQVRTGVEKLAERGGAAAEQAEPASESSTDPTSWTAHTDDV